MTNLGEIVTRTFCDVPILYRNGTTDELVFDFDYIKTRFLPENFVLPKDGIILDVGGHIGVLGILAAQRVPEGTVHIIEPSSDNFQILTRNIDAAVAGEVQVFGHRIALGAENGTLRLYRAPGSVGHSFYPQAEWAHESFEPQPKEFGTMMSYEEVQVETLTSFLARIGNPTIDYMKMNIEGAEYDVLLTSPEATLSAIRCMTIEMHPEKEGKTEQVMDRLHKLGFRTSFKIASDNPYVKGWVTAQNA